MQKFQNIAKIAREIVYQTYSTRPAYKHNILLKKKIETLTGKCRETSEVVKKMLKNQNIKSKLVNVRSMREGGGNHIAVYIPSKDIIIDPTINQYGYGNKYVYKLGEYPGEILK